MRKAIAVLCCTLLMAASTPQQLHHPMHPAHKKLKLPAIAVSRTEDGLVIINLHAALALPPGYFRQPEPDAARLPAALMLPLPGARPGWPGLAGLENDRNSPAGPGAPSPGQADSPRASPGAGEELPDIGDAAAYEQLALDKPCKTIAHCNWLGVRAIREGAPRKALRPFRTALQLATQQHDDYMTRIGYHNLAMTYWWMKHYRQASAWALKGLATELAADTGRKQEASIAEE